MYILNGSKKEVLNSDFIERICIAEKDNGDVLIIASYGDGPRPATMAKYKDLKEAQDVLGDMLRALAGGQTYYEMPESRLFYEQVMIKDARTRRKGGS